jgi:tetratricopeptide (TPR) repeat protein
MKTKINSISVLISLLFVTTGTINAQENKTERGILLTAGNCVNAVMANNVIGIKENCVKLQELVKTEKKGSIDYLRAQTSLSVYLTVKNETRNAANSLLNAIKSVKANDLNANTYKLKAYTILGNIYEVRKEWDDASKAISKSIEIADKIGNKTSVIDGIISMASIRNSMGDHKRSLIYAKKTLEYANNLGESRVVNWPQVQFAINRMIAIAYTSNRDLDNGLKHALVAYDYAKVSYKSDPLAMPLIGINSDIAAIYSKKGEFSKALPYAEAAVSALEIEAIPVTKEVTFAFMNLIKAYTMLDKITEAKVFVGKYGFRFEDIPDSPDKVQVLGTIGMFYMKNTTNKEIAKHYLVNATLASINVFGKDALTTNEMASAADSPELDKK